MLKLLMPSINLLINKDYSSIKSEETETIIENMLYGLKSVERPTLLQVSGIPGAGKSTYCKTHQLPNYLYLSFDNIMLTLKGYQQVLLQKGSVQAFNQYEMMARIIGYELLSRAISKKINIMLEHSGTNKAHIELFANIQKIGYNTSINFIMCNKDVAIKRAQKRAEQTKRYVPKSLIEERADKFNFYMQEYQKITPSINILDGTNNFFPLKKI